MSLRPSRQTHQVNIDFICPWTQERGGCLVLASASGMQFAEYAHDPSGMRPMGIQLNDIEWMNLARQYNRQYRNGVMTEVPCGIVGVGVEGEFITDWIHLVGDVQHGDTAYAGPSGTFTNSAGLGGMEVGKFIGTLDSDPHTVVFRGLGFSRQYIDPCTKQPVWENNPADRVHVISPGYIKIKVEGLQ